MKNAIKLIITTAVFGIIMTACQPNIVYDNDESYVRQQYETEYGSNNGNNNGGNDGNNDNNGGNTSTTIPSNMQGTWYDEYANEYYFYNDRIEMNDGNNWVKLFDIISCDSQYITVKQVSYNDTSTSTYTLSGDSLYLLNVTFTRTSSSNNNNGDSNDSGDNNNGNNGDNNSENTSTTIPSNMQGTWYASSGCEYYFYNDKIELRSGDIHQKLYDITNCDSQSITFSDPIYKDSIGFDDKSYTYTYAIYGDGTLCLSYNEGDRYFYREIENNNNNDEYTPYTSAGMPYTMLYGWIEVGTGFHINVSGDVIGKYFPNKEYNQFIEYEVISCDSTSLTLRDRNNDNNTYYCSYTISGNTMIWSGDISMSCIRYDYF